MYLVFFFFVIWYSASSYRQFKIQMNYPAPNMWCLKATLFFCVLCLASATHPDEVSKLPGLNFPLNYRHYSGYLNASEEKHLHYWFVESQSSPSSDPLVLWLNGGPGCSSLEGFLAELGPLHVNNDGKTLYKNPYSWNKNANVLFLEAPAGVGFSYADNEVYDTNDDMVSAENYAALQHFFQKFPQFKPNDFYITGESYGGIYIPTLSVRVLEGPADIKFKGFAIGNGYLDVGNLSNSIVFFAYYHGLIGVQLWEQLSLYCCNGVATAETCNFANPSSAQCADVLQRVSKIVGGSGLNIYNLYSDCAQSNYKHSSYAVNRRNLLRPFLNLHQLSLLSDDPPCTDSSSLRNYLNQKTVRAALHIPTKVQKWELCSTAVESGYKRKYDTMRPQVLKLLNAGLRGLVYNGDVDMACNFLGDEWFTNDLGLDVLKEYSPWKFDHQIAGFVKYYSKNLAFLTIKGSGHMVPQDKPGPAFKMISSFLKNKPY